jgi:hypothetical protein
LAAKKKPAKRKASGRQRGAGAQQPATPAEQPVAPATPAQPMPAAEQPAEAAPAPGETPSETTVAPAKPGPKFRLLLRAMGKWLRQNIPEAIVFALLGALLGWLLNVVLMAIRYEGFAVPPGAPATGQSNLISGSLFWLVGTTVFFGMISYWRAVGSKQFFREIREFPGNIGRLFTRDREKSLVHLLWGFAGAMLATQFVSPSIGAVLAIGLLVAVPSIIGDIIADLLQRIWSEILKVFAPSRRTSLTSSVAMIVGVVGAAVALAVAFFFVGRIVKIILMVAAGVAAFAIGQTRRRPAAPTPTATAMLIFVLVAAGILATAGPARADDGGWLECGGTLAAYIRCGAAGGVISVIIHSLFGGAAGFLGGIFGGGLGGALGQISRADAARGMRRSGEPDPITEFIDTILDGPLGGLKDVIKTLADAGAPQRRQLWENAKALSQAAQTPAESFTADLLATRALELELAERARTGVDTVQLQVAIDAQKQQMERWKIQQTTQTSIFEIMQDVTVNKARTQDRAWQKLDEFIRQ